MRSSTIHYSLGALPVTGVGLGVEERPLQQALTGPVATLVCDDLGARSVGDFLEGLADTEFARENLEALFRDDVEPEDWRVGEALAEHYLIECHDCCFPWPNGRDERKRGSSLPGADLVGFQCHGGQERFAFGEVKTSSDASYPPSTVYGRHGLKQQMEDLRDRRDIRDGLVLYLGHRAINASWGDRYKAAAAVYLGNTSDVILFGLLVRDVEPHLDDLRVRVDKLAIDCPEGMAVELTALYLPPGSVSKLSTTVVASRQQRGGTR